MSDLTLIIPAKNEVESLPQVLDELKDFNFKINIVLESSDKLTIESIKNYNCNIIYQDSKGYGDALKKGIDSVDTELFCIFVADGSFNPKELDHMISKIENDNNDTRILAEQFAMDKVYSFEIDQKRVNSVRRSAYRLEFQHGIPIGYPIVKEYDYLNDNATKSLNALPKVMFKPRQYQSRALNKMFGNKRVSIIYVLPFSICVSLSISHIHTRLRRTTNTCIVQ